MKVTNKSELQATCAEMEIQEDNFFDVKEGEEFDLVEKIKSIFSVGDVVKLDIKRVEKSEDSK